MALASCRPALAFFLLAAAFVSRAAAECVEIDTPCRDYAHHSVVFQGRVVRITPLGRPDASAPKLIRFEVERAWKGVDGTSADLFEGDTLDLDYHGYVAGERYIVYANREPEGRIRAFACGRTKPLAEAKADLEFLESLSRPATGGKIFGTVLVERAGEVQPGPLPDVRVVLERGPLRREGSSAADGRFQFGRLTPGRYSVSIELPAGYAVAFAQPFVGPVVDHRPPAASTVQVEIEGDRDCTLVAFILRR